MTTIWIDALEFEDYGGFTAETQFVQEMGQGYLFACQVPGIPVADASTRFTVPEAGRYRIWVRTKNWYKTASPGRLKVLADRAYLPRELGGLPTELWCWEAAGDAELSAGEHELTVQDTTGYFGRFAAVIITDDMDFTPEQELRRLWKERAAIRGESAEPKDGGSYDVIVAGGGPAGVPAAIAAARKGMRTLILHSRPGLGGNASDEGTVGFDGAYAVHPNTREGGIAEEIRRTRDHEHLSWEGALKRLCAAEPNLTIAYNQFLMDADTENGRIRSVTTIDCIDSSFTTYRGKMFIDCTGDGWLGYYAGAKYRLGREAKWQYGEEFAPECPDNLTMSGCLMGSVNGEQILGYYAEDAGHPTVFTAPEWAVKLPKGDDLHRAPGRLHTGEWWVENPTDMDDLWEQEAIRDELLRLNLGYFDWVKNSYSRRDVARNLQITAFGRYNAKRETRRIIGDYVLTQNDCQGATFPDAVSYCGWPLDVHHPRGLYSGAEGPYYSNARVPVTEIPFRCLYSKNIENLMMAGRCMSVSHLALGTVRVQNTLATLGQAAGTAAARCIREKITPRGIYETQMADFQQELLRDDLYIPSIVNEDPRDLAKSARITATSVSRTERYNLHRGVENGFLPLDGTLAMSRSLPQKAQYVRVLLRNEKEVPVPVRASLLAMKSAGDYEGAAVHDRAEAVVPARFEGWFDLPLDCNVSSPAIGVALEPAEGLSWQSLACTCFEKWSGRRLNAYRWEADSKRSFAAEFFPEELPLADCSPESVARGASRIVSETEYGWVSDPSEPLPQSITLSWDGEQELHQVQLIFDTDLINPAYSYVTLPIVKRTVSDYRVEVSTADGWKTVAEVTDNFLRRNTLSFPAVQSDALRVTVLKTCGDPSARIFEIRVY